MLNPNVDPFFRHVVRIQHQEMLKEIEAERLYHQLQHQQPGLRQRIGRWVKAHTRPRPAEPCFDGS